MSRWEDELVDPFLAEVEPGEVEILVDGCAHSLGEVDLPRGLRERLLSSATLDGRFERFVEVATGLLDLEPRRVRDLLDGIGRAESWSAGPLPGVHTYDLPKGPKNLDAITGFIRMPEGSVFPEHRHLGEESVLVLAGSFLDEGSGAIHRAGDVIALPAGSSHGISVRPGPDLIYLAVVQRGIAIGDDVIGPNDPRL